MRSRLMLLTEGDYKILYCCDSPDEFDECDGDYREVQYDEPDPETTYLASHKHSPDKAKLLSAEKASEHLQDNEWAKDVADTMLANLQPGEYTVPDEDRGSVLRLKRIT